MINPKERALSEFLSVKPSEIEISDDENYMVNGEEYLVLTDNEADERAKEYIRESLWAFNAGFIVDRAHENIETNSRVVNAVQKMQEVLCEDANEIVYCLIGDFDEFADDALTSDGRGHFMSHYDGEEHEQNGLFIYRIN